MKLKFKKQAYQTNAVEAVIDCFIGQPNFNNKPNDIRFNQLNFEEFGFRNSDLQLSSTQLLDNINNTQIRQNLPLSLGLNVDKKTGFVLNLDIEMETGTGKTYCYIKTMFELNRRYGWKKFIIIVPSIAIREGVAKSLEITAEHFLEEYKKRARFFIYNSKQLYNLESYSSDGGINVMIINVQAFNVTGKDARKIYEELLDRSADLEQNSGKIRAIPGLLV